MKYKVTVLMCVSSYYMNIPQGSTLILQVIPRGPCCVTTTTNTLTPTLVNTRRHYVSACFSIYTQLV